MKTTKLLTIGILIGIVIAISGISLMAFSSLPSDTIASNKATDSRDVYYPGSEDLGADEMRVVALGTGMPNARPKQAAACWLVELGNGDKFIFDMGLGAAERLSAQKAHYDYLDKVFLGHLHADHIGDLDALWIGGVISNRQRPLRIWGPNSTKERKMGHKIYGGKNERDVCLGHGFKTGEC